MDLRKLRYFAEVAEQGSITQAAVALHMTQPALSRQIRAFEEEMGWPLLDRGAKSVRLTRQGQVVLREGKAILKAVSEGVSRMQREVDGGVIRIGYAPSLGGELLKQAMGCFIQRHPDVRIDLRDSTSEEMHGHIRAGTLDLMIGVQMPLAGFAWENLYEKPLVMAVPAGHGLSKRRQIPAADLAGQRILLLSRHDYPEYWNSVTSYFRNNGVNAKVAGEFDGIDSLSVALQAGIGMAMVAEHAAVGKGVKLIPLNPQPASVKVAVGWRDDRPLDTITSAFVEELLLHKRSVRTAG